MTIFWIFVVAVVVAVLQAAVFNFFNLRRIEYTRYFSKDVAYEGDKLELVEVIKNRKPLPVPWLRVESRISNNLRFGSTSGGEHDIDAERYHRSVFFMGPFRQITRRHEVTCLKRGKYSAGSIALTSGDLLSYGNNSIQLQLPCELTVYPMPASESEINTLQTRWQGDLTVRRWIMPDPFLIYGIREYRDGDSMKDVHWRATARTGQMQVKVWDYTVDPRVLVILNVQNSEEQWGDLMDYEQEGIERGIRIAAALCLRALAAGVESGFASNGCLQGQKDSGNTVYVPARRSFDQAERILDTLARMVIHRESNFPRFLEEFTDPINADMLILSTYDSPLIQRGVEAMRSRGNSVTVHLLERGTLREKAG